MISTMITTDLDKNIYLIIATCSGYHYFCISNPTGSIFHVTIIQKVHHSKACDINQNPLPYFEKGHLL